jgi:hypothetical protein
MIRQYGHRDKKWAGVIAAGAIVLGALMLLAGSFTPGIQANGPGHIQVFDRDSVVYGRTYGEWSAAWEQWADSIPTAHHPLFDNGDVSVGQSGPVWFLGGKFCNFTATNCGTTNVVRSAQVPAGKALYVAVFNAEDSALEDSSRQQIADLRSFVQAWIDASTDVSMEVDGQPIHDLTDKFRVQSPAFGFTIPDDNLFTAVGEGTFKAGSYFPGVDDGVYVMLAPPAPGHHTLHFHGSSNGFTLDITYLLYVHP